MTSYESSGSVPHSRRVAVIAIAAVTLMLQSSSVGSSGPQLRHCGCCIFYKSKGGERKQKQNNSDSSYYVSVMLFYISC